MVFIGKLILSNENLILLHKLIKEIIIGIFFD